ncbi:MAG: tetratricopeptide repeat protein [Campylobacterota bacterium]|nr:tetratricopeptide repeat protein [Campylobacterota bacterium]
MDDFKSAEEAWGKGEMEQALQIFKTLANKGNTAAQYNIGMIYMQQKKYTEGHEWLSKAADNNEADAQFHLGRIYYLGLGKDQDIKQALNWFKKAARQRHARAYYYLGKIIYDYNPHNDKNLSKVFQAYLDAATLGDPEAQYQLGYMYYRGIFIKGDMDKAGYWFGKASEQGHQKAEFYLSMIWEEVKPNPEAQFYTGLSLIKNDDSRGYFAHARMYTLGNYVCRNHHKSVSLYQQAARYANHEQRKYQINIAYQFYLNGHPQDDTAFQILKAYAVTGDMKAQHYLAVMHEEQANHAEALKWYLKAAEQGFSRSQYIIGIWLLWGRHIQRDEDEGVKWLEKAAEQGNAWALYALANFYKIGRMVNRKKSFEYFKQAAKIGLGEHDLSVFYARGEYKDINMEIYWLKKAAEHGGHQAQFELACMYTNEAYKDEELAQYWLKRAANGGHTDANKLLENPSANVKPFPCHSWD